VLENADVSESERLNKIILRESDCLFAAEAQHIEHEHDDEHEHDSPKLGYLVNYIYFVNRTLDTDSRSLRW
jgi:hypothetical protein